MIGYFGSVIFETSDRKICNFNGLKRSASASYSDHKRFTKKPQREFNNPENETISFVMKIKAGHGVSPRKMIDTMFDYCENGTVCIFILGGRKVGGGKWTVDSVDADYKTIWNRGEIVSVELSVTATEYR